MGALPEFLEPQQQQVNQVQQPLVLAVQQPVAPTTTNPQPEPKPLPDFATVVNPPRSTFKFAGRPKTLITTIETEEPIAFSISEDLPGPPGPRERGAPVGSIGRYADFSVLLGPDPSRQGSKASGELHQSNPYFLLSSGRAYFAGSTAMGETTRFRTAPDSTEYVIHIDETGAAPVHRVINISTIATHTVRVICPASDTGAIYTLQPCRYMEFPTANCNDRIEGEIAASDVVKKFLESIEVGVPCLP